MDETSYAKIRTYGPDQEYFTITCILSNKHHNDYVCTYISKCEYLILNGESLELLQILIV